MPAQLDLALTKAWTREEALVFDVVRRREGRDQAVARADLVARTGLSDRACRDAIASLVTAHGYPIGSSPRGGYYWITDPAELRREAARLGRYVANIARRMRALVGSDAAKRILGQTDLFQEET